MDAVRSSTSHRALNERTPEADVAKLIGATGRSTDDPALLVDLMREAHPVYRGRSTNAVIRMRGYAMAAFERVGLPDAALIFVIEELESGRDAYLVAAAAKALRGLDTRERRVVPFLFRAIENVRYHDDTVSFETYLPTWPAPNPTTALTEIFETFAWLGPNAAYALPRLSAFEAEAGRLPGITRAALERAMTALQSDAEIEDASCCQPAGRATLDEVPGRLERRSGVGEPPLAAQFEDQDGRRASYGDLFVGRPSVVVFFYTRCTNPNKCSLTITKLARLQDAITERGLAGRLRTAAITYDPEFDLPPRLRAYGDNRGVRFDELNRLIRATKGFRSLSRYFGLGVNYGPALVNRHRIEAFILDDAGRIAMSFARLQWDVREVLDRVTATSHGSVNA
jgi:protein SCO1/2